MYGFRPLLVVLDIFSRFVKFRQGKESMPKTHFKHSNKRFLKKRLLKFWVYKKTEHGRCFKKICNCKDIEIYSTMSETNTAFAMRAKKIEKSKAFIITL